MTPTTLDRRTVANTLIRYFDGQDANNAPTNLLRLAAELMEHVSYDIAISHGTNHTIQLLELSRRAIHLADAVETSQRPRRLA